MSIKTGALATTLTGSALLLGYEFVIGWFVSGANALLSIVRTLTDYPVSLLDNAFYWVRSLSTTAWYELGATVRPFGPFAPLVFAAVMLATLWLVMSAADYATGRLPP